MSAKQKLSPRAGERSAGTDEGLIEVVSDEERVLRAPEDAGVATQVVTEPTETGRDEKVVAMP